MKAAPFTFDKEKVIRDHQFHAIRSYAVYV
jgi:hypothetical protein